MSFLADALAEVDRKMKKSGTQIEMTIEEADMNRLLRYQVDIDGETFRKLFIELGGTPSMAEHLWSKFHYYDHQIIKLWADLDSTNRKLVLAMINRWRVK